MEWVILFCVSWTLFFLLVDWKTLKTNIWCGVVAMVLQMLVDTQAMGHKLYEIKGEFFDIYGSSALFVFGPIFVIGVLLSQFHPTKRSMIIVNVFVLTLLFSLQELCLLTRKSLIYTNWHYSDSIQVNIGAMVLLSWFCIIVIRKVRYIE